MRFLRLYQRVPRVRILLASQRVFLRRLRPVFQLPHQQACQRQAQHHHQQVNHHLSRQYLQVLTNCNEREIFTKSAPRKLSMSWNAILKLFQIDSTTLKNSFYSFLEISNEKLRFTTRLDTIVVILDLF